MLFVSLCPFLSYDYDKKERGLIPIACSESPTKGTVQSKKERPRYSAGASTFTSRTV